MKGLHNLRPSYILHIRDNVGWRHTVHMARLTKDEMQERVDYTAFLYARRVPKSQMIMDLKERYSISWRQAERYMAEARKLARKVARISPEKALRDAINFYLSVISDPDADMFAKLKAQERLDKLHGHDVLVHRVSGDKSNPIQVNHTLQIDPMALIKEVRQVMDNGEIIEHDASQPTAIATEDAEGSADLHREAEADGADEAGSGG